MDRYHRQTLLPFIGEAGRDRLSASRVLLVGCGALGSVIADQLVRAGLGELIIADRDVVEMTNLQRQVLFDEQDARDGVPKAVAAPRRLAAVNSTVRIEPRVVDVHSGNIEALAGLEAGGTRVDLILDGTDNAQTRYLVNDVAVKHGVPWVYGACVGADGRVMSVRPGVGPCLRCVFPVPPSAGELPTCDTAGVLASATAVVASMQVVASLKLLLGASLADDRLLAMDLWNGRFRSIAADRQEHCVCCTQRQFEFLDRPIEQSAIQLCGQNAVQIRAERGERIELKALAERLTPLGHVTVTDFLVRCRPTQERGVQLTVFADGRTVVQGTSDPSRARILVSRYVGL
ncbi:MAG TPA: ThiF family adenylyltransferase [Tepidisphaeraceae bacterium]|nr:ThiF family adenylyltransferase [Tepidisphaeraceae bacterium]